MKLSSDTEKRIREWTSPPFDSSTIKEIKSLVDKNDYSELNERFGAELEFGTGGLRGIIRNGTNGMNKYVVAVATQGLANYIKKLEIENPSVAIAFDSRNYSAEFALETAAVLAANDIRAYIYRELRPVPQLSFTVRHFGCTAGIVITASHNPKEYNGYKVFWSDGAQVIKPHDEGIINEVRNVGSYADVTTGNSDYLIENGMIQWIDDITDRAYIQELVNNSICLNEIENSGVKTVYSPLHGSGAAVIPLLFDEIGYQDVIYVEEQMTPDGDFPTVKKPNPEEREALNIAIEYASRYDGDIVIATDPDCDRMGIAVKNKTGGFDVLSGNHTGAILEYFILSMKKEQGGLPDDGAVVKTIVTTDLQDRIAEHFGLKVFNVLTGFKYIGEKIRHFEEDSDYSYVFGGEESYGYLAGTYARDKDAAMAVLHIVECCAWLKNKGLTITDYLEEIFREFGYYNDVNVSIEAPGLAGVETIKSVMKNFRENPPGSIGGVEVVTAYDFKKDEVPDSEGSSYVLPPSDVLQYKLKDGTKVTVRPSGTEPKIKFYFSSMGPSMKETEDKIKGMIDDIIPGVKAFIAEQEK